jgi:hypothetical protein
MVGFAQDVHSHSEISLTDDHPPKKTVQVDVAPAFGRAKPEPCIAIP